MKSDLTLLLCTHGRPGFLRRSLKYYGGLGVRIIVLDSSVDEALDVCALYSDVDYIHCPEYGYQGFREKLERGVSLVRTPYMVFVADDDFVLHEALSDSVGFLKANLDYGICHGYCLMYLPEKEKIHYFLRDKKVAEDFSNDSPGDRLLHFMSNYIPPWYAVSRTDIVRDWYSEMPDDTGMEFQEFGHAFYFLIRTKARILNRPYVVREVNYPVSDHGTDLLAALSRETPELSSERTRFHGFMCALLQNMGFSASHASQLLMEAMERLVVCLSSQRSLTVQEIFHSEWKAFSARPTWRFESEQFVEMPFYNRPFFNALEMLDLLVRMYPLGKLQVRQLQDVLAEQDVLVSQGQLLDEMDQGFCDSLRAAFDNYPFHRDLVQMLANATSAVDLCEWRDLLAEVDNIACNISLPDPEKVERTAPALLQRGPVQQWLERRSFTPVQVKMITEYLKLQAGVDFIFCILDLDDDAEGLAGTIKSLSGNELLPVVWKIFVLTTSEKSAMSMDEVHFIPVAEHNYVEVLNELMSSEAGSWLMLLRAGEVVTENGLVIAALELSTTANTCRAVCGDELQRLPDGELGACFRPDFNLDMLLSLPAMMARHWFFRRECLVAAGGFDKEFGAALEFEMLVRLLELGGMAGLGHISEALVISDVSALVDNEQEISVLNRHIAWRGYKNGMLGEGLPGRYRIHYGHQSKPLVSIIIPTKDQLPILQRCVESLLEKTAYSNYELLIVDNKSETPEAQAWFSGVEAMADDKVRILRYPYPFNYSAINNMAAREARGEYLVLLNNDTAIISESWLDELLNHALRPEVGIVGAKLLFPSGRVQHAGVILGLRGPADHPFIGEPMDAPGYIQRLQVDQNYSAVTAACLMIRKSIYAEVGGLDEESFKVSYNDVDLCLKVREAGHLIVWTPHSVVMHEGSVSQARIDPKAAEAKRKRFSSEQDAMYGKWLSALACDPAYNRNLSLNGKGFELEMDSNLSWRPLSWRPLPVVLAHQADPWGCGNYRVIKPFAAMKEKGMVDGMLSEGLLQVVDLERYSPDSIVLQRQIGDERLEAMRRIKAFSRAFKVYELDDYLPNLPMKSVHREHMPKDILKSLRRGLGFVDRFVVSTQPLAEAFAGLHDDIRVVENRLPLDWWGGLHGARRRGQKPRVGWAGGASHTGDLELLLDVVRELAGEVEWVFFGMCPEKLRPFVKEVHAGVDIDRYPAALAALNLDLAIAPVEQNLFNECKSNLRLLEYGACGFPVVCSDLVCYQGDLPVTRVKNRFRDWVDAIRMHINDLDAAAAAGDELRRQVMKHWMLSGENLEQWRTAWLPD